MKYPCLEFRISCPLANYLNIQRGLWTLYLFLAFSESLFFYFSWSQEVSNIYFFTGNLFIVFIVNITFFCLLFFLLVFSQFFKLAFGKLFRLLSSFHRHPSASSLASAASVDAFSQKMFSFVSQCFNVQLEVFEAKLAVNAAAGDLS